MTCTVAQRRRGAVTELHLTAFPSAGRSAFAEVADALRRHRARILLERVFAQTADLGRLGRERADAYRELDDGIAPTWLTSPDGREGSLAAVQVHAVASADPPRAMGARARIFHHPDAGLLTVSALAAPAAGEVPAQCAAVLAELAATLERAGTSLGRAARMWLWIDPIYRWYGELNRARNSSFREHGLIAPDGRAVHLPASTGIGLRPAIGAISLEAMAALDGAPRTLSAGGNQGCALGYGSAFSRAASLRTPGGETHLVSGTAAIDAQGQTVDVGDPEAQVADTIENVRAVLRELAVGEADIVQGVAYCLDPAVVEVWRRRDPGWPLAVVLADICRDNLLFEIELTACPGASRGD